MVKKHPSTATEEAEKGGWYRRPSILDASVTELPARKDWWEPCPQTILRIDAPREGVCVSLSDIHFPHEDKRAVALVLSCLRYRVSKQGRIHTIVLNGDIVDNYELSSHSKLPSRVGVPLSAEFDSVRQFVVELRKLCRHLVWTMGNHENRYWRTVVDNPGLYGLVQSFNDFARIPKDVTCLPYGTMVLWGDTLIDHGEVTAKNVASTAWARYQSQMVLGHSHRSGTHMFTHPITKERQYVVAQGTLCDFKSVDFTRQPPWNLGWAEVYSWVDSNGVLRTRPIQREIEGYSVNIDGNIYRG